MPAGKRQQDSTMITLVIFGALFLIAAVVAVWSYSNSEGYKTRLNELQLRFNELASSSEAAQVTGLIGNRQAGQTWLGALLDYHNQLFLLILGAPLDSTSAEIRTSTAQKRIAELVQSAQVVLGSGQLDPNMGLVPLQTRLVEALSAQKEANLGLEKQLNALQTRLDDVTNASKQKEQDLQNQIEQLRQLAFEANRKAEEYRELLNQSSEDRARTLSIKLEEQRQRAEQLESELSGLRAEMNVMGQKLELALDKVRRIAPEPNRAAELLRPDGRITVVDDHGGVVYINLGSNDRVYMGLRFAVYDGAGAVPPDGKGKAEIEVFKIMPDTSVARIVSRDPKRPIVIDDIVVNIIWDKDKIYKFALVGQFDINKDGKPDPDGLELISQLLTKWGAETTGDISPFLDALIIGQAPYVPPQPTAQQRQQDPLAQERYEAAHREYEHYRTIQQQAVRLMIPIIPYENFLYLIGHKGKALVPDAF